MDVIGVGGIDFEDNIARFSSRGMTTWVGFFHWLNVLKEPFVLAPLGVIYKCAGRKAACKPSLHRHGRHSQVCGYLPSH